MTLNELALHLIVLKELPQATATQIPQLSKVLEAQDSKEVKAEELSGCMHLEDLA